MKERQLETVRAMFVAVGFLAAASGRGADAAPPGPIQGKVTMVDPGTRQVEINCGSQQRVVSKMVFYIYGQAEVLYLPLTGKDVVHLPKEIGNVQVLEVSEKSCRGKVFASDMALVKKDAVVIGYPVPVGSQLKPDVKSVAAKPDSPVIPGSRVILTVSALDPDGDPLTYEWACAAGRLSAARTVEPSVVWTAPVAPGDYVLSVVAIDSDRFKSDPKEFRVTVGAYIEDRHKVPFKFSRVVSPEPFFEEVAGVACDRLNGLYVVDPRAQKVKKVDPDGVTVTYFGQEGNETGKFRKPGRVACMNDFVYVVDRERQVVIKFNLRGGFLKEYGEPGTANAQVTAAEDVAVSPSGDVFIADSEGARVQVYDDQGRFLFSVGQRGTGPGQFQKPVAVAVDRQGMLYVLDAGRQQLILFDRDLRFRGREIKVAGQAADFDLDPMQGVAYLLYPEEKAVKKLLLGEGRFDAAFKVGGEGEGWGRFADPVAVACDPFGEILVADAARRTRNIQRFNDKGECLARLGGEDYSKTIRVTAGSEGDLYCLSREGTIRRLTATGWTTARFGGEGAPGSAREPVDLAVGPGGFVYLLDGNTCQIRKFKPTGEFVGDFIQASDAKQLKRLLDEPTDLAAAGDQVFVMDKGGNRVQILGADGVFRTGLDGSDKKNKSLYMNGDAEFVAVEPASGKIVVSLGTSLKVCAKELTFVEEWGKKGSENGQFRGITGLAFDHTGDLWVLDRSRGDVQRFRFGAPGNSFLSVVKDDNRARKPVDFAVSPFNELWVWDGDKGTGVIFVQE